MKNVTVTGPGGNLLTGEDKITINRGKKPDPKTEPAAPIQEAAPPKEEKKEDKAPTPEEMEQRRQQFQERMWGNSGVGRKREKAKEEKPEPKDEAKEPETEKKKEEEKPEPKVEKKPEPKAKPAKEEKTEEQEEEVEEEDEEKELEALKAPTSNKPEPSSKPTMTKPDQSTLPDNLNQKQKRYIRNLEELETLNPKKYSGIAGKAVKFWEMETQKIAEWEKTHSGEDYDPAAQEHASWYEKHQPDIDEDDLDEAKEMRIQKDVEARAAATTNEITDKQDAKIKMREVEGEVFSVTRDSKFELVKIAAPELFELCKVGGKPIFSKDTVEKITDHDPIAAEVLNDAASRIGVVIYELEYLTRFPKHYAIDEEKTVKLANGDRIKPHAEIVQFMETLEGDLSGMPKEKTMKGTRKFITHSQYNQRVRAIKESNLAKDGQGKALSELQGRYWTLGPLDVRKAYVADQADQASQKIQKLNSLAERKYNKTPKSQVVPDKEKEAEDEKKRAEEASAANGKQRKQVAPASISASDKTDTSGKALNKGPGNNEMINKKMWGS